MSPRTCLDHSANRKTSWPCRESKHDSRVIQLVPSHYTGFVIPAHWSSFLRINTPCLIFNNNSQVWKLFMLEFVAGRLQCLCCITLQIKSDRVRKLPLIYSATILFLENFKLNSEHSSAGLTYIFLHANWPVCQLFNIYVPFSSGKILTRLHSSNLVWPGVDRLLCGLVLVTRTTRRVN